MERPLLVFEVSAGHDGYPMVLAGLGISEGLGGTRWVSPGEGISKDLSWVKAGLNGFW